MATSDHFQPWRHSGGHSPAALPWLGAATLATEEAVLGTSALTPTLRYEPAIVAQAFGVHLAFQRSSPASSSMSRLRSRSQAFADSELNLACDCIAPFVLLDWSSVAHL